MCRETPARSRCAGSFLSEVVWAQARTSRELQRAVPQARNPPGDQRPGIGIVSSQSLCPLCPLWLRESTVHPADASFGTANKLPAASSSYPASVKSLPSFPMLRNLSYLAASLASEVMALTSVSVREMAS